MFNSYATFRAKIVSFDEAHCFICHPLGLAVSRKSQNGRFRPSVYIAVSLCE